MGLIAEKLGVPSSQVTRVAVWGNNSESAFIDLHAAMVGDRPALKAINDPGWVEQVLGPTIASRAGEIHQLRGNMPAARSPGDPGDRPVDHHPDAVRPMVRGGRRLRRQLRGSARARLRLPAHHGRRARPGRSSKPAISMRPRGSGSRPTSPRSSTRRRPSMTCWGRSSERSTFERRVGVPPSGGVDRLKPVLQPLDPGVTRP